MASCSVIKQRTVRCLSSSTLALHFVHSRIVNCSESMRSVVKQQFRFRCILFAVSCLHAQHQTVKFCIYKDNTYDLLSWLISPNIVNKCVMKCWLKTSVLHEYRKKMSITHNTQSTLQHFSRYTWVSRYQTVILKQTWCQQPSSRALSDQLCPTRSIKCVHFAYTKLFQIFISHLQQRHLWSILTIRAITFCSICRWPNYFYVFLCNSDRILSIPSLSLQLTDGTSFHKHLPPSFLFIILVSSFVTGLVSVPCSMLLIAALLYTYLS